MVTFGNLSEFSAFFLSALTCAFILVGLMRNDIRFIESGRRGIYGMTVFTTLS